MERRTAPGSGGGQLVCTCPLPSTPTTPTTPTTPPTVVCQVYDYGADRVIDCAQPACDSGGSSSWRDKLGHRVGHRKPPRSPKIPKKASGKSRKGSSDSCSGSHAHLRVTDAGGRPPDEWGHSAPETEREEEQEEEEHGFEWRWFHRRRKHSESKSRSRSSSHLFGGHSPGRPVGIAGLRLSPVSSCCGGSRRVTTGTGSHGSATSPPDQQDADSAVYGGALDHLPPSSPASGDAPSGTSWRPLARNGLRVGRKQPAARKRPPPLPTTVSAVINPGQAHLVLLFFYF
ncbi:serine/arginine repetitive matrix protein 3-like [Anopheles merus]|uniref:serine/arginine repetitive matrix protein 3-like n=1 Tax=Anopheles merus TaxID=30066 RepID=UPI001BE4B4FD|nr:serine/arginine repetitive matrix protein 3-like [Anopheles merus]